MLRVRKGINGVDQCNLNQFLFDLSKEGAIFYFVVVLPRISFQPQTDKTTDCTMGKSNSSNSNSSKRRRKNRSATNSSLDSSATLGQEPMKDFSLRNVESNEKILEELELMKKQIYSLQTNNDILKNENRQLKQSLIDLDQYGRRHNLRFLGIPEHEKENCEDIIMGVIKNKLKIESNIFIDVAHRVGKQNYKAPRPIIVRFGFRKHANEVLANRRKLKGERLTIVEDLNPSNARIFGSARKYGQFNSVWTKNGKVLGSTKEGNIIHIRTEIPNPDAETVSHVIDLIPNSQISSSQSPKRPYQKAPFKKTNTTKPKSTSTSKTSYNQQHQPQITRYTVTSQNINNQILETNRVNTQQAPGTSHDTGGTSSYTTQHGDNLIMMSTNSGKEKESIPQPNPNEESRD